MIAARTLITFVGALFLVSLSCGFTSTPASQSPALIVTAATAYDALAALRGAERFPAGAQLLLFERGSAKPLVSGFAATADANVSFDATHLLFAGKKAIADPWSIWELTVADGSVRAVLTAGTDLIRPLYLPGNRLVYAHRFSTGYRLEAASLDGTQVTPLSFVPGSAIPEDVLADGRILFTSFYPLGSGSSPGSAELYLTYSDGSGVESYRCDHGVARWGGRQLSSGDIVFTKGTALARFTSSLAAESPIPAPAGTYQGGILESALNTWTLSVRPLNARHFALFRWRPGAQPLTPALSRPDLDLVDPVALAPRNRPRQHPSSLHDWDYANLLALNVRESREGDLQNVPAAVQLETQDSSGRAITLGNAPVESDGSFFVKVPADVPLRFSMHSADGSIVRQEHGWFWIRKGEQRICVGCHTGPERASDNRVPAVLVRSTTPADLTTPRAVPPVAQGTR